MQRGRPVLIASLREGTMDFINIVPRIALGVIGSGYIAAVIPQEIITGWLGPDCGWLGVLTAVIAGAATPGGPVVGFSIGAVALKAGGGAPQVIAYVIAWALFAFQRLLAVGNPVHAGAVRLVPRGGVAAVSVPGRGHRDGDREAVRPTDGLGGHPLCYNITFSDGSFPPPQPRTMTMATPTATGRRRRIRRRPRPGRSCA